jgi:hypothetical protein
MNRNQDSENRKAGDEPKPARTEGRAGSAHELEEYAGGYIQARHGKVNLWLVVVIVALIVWAIYYGFTYWGGLGEGLDY